MSKHLILVGGGHAHMTTLAGLHAFVARGHAVSVVGPSPYHYYSGMGPGMLGRTYRPEEIRFATRQVVEKQGGAFVSDKVLRVDPQARSLALASGRTLTYDVLSFNAGSHVPRTAVRGPLTDVYTVKPIEALLTAQQRILERLAQGETAVGVVGGGPSSAEIAGNIWRLARDHGARRPAITILAGRHFMSRFHAGVRRRIASSLTRRGIAILENGYATEIQSGAVLLDSGERHTFDLIFLALGVEPSPIFRASGLPTGPNGGLRVNRYLQCTAHPEIFGGGDCIHFQDHPLDKVGVYAVRQNPVLYHNLLAALEERPLQAFDPGGDYLLIFNLGDGTGVLKKKGLIFGGRPAFWIKDAIDRRFMRKFQALE